MLLIMAQEPQLYKALRQQLLWPSVHAAADVYSKRSARGAGRGAGSYELIWRLIHISESVVITLASAAIARLRTMPESGPEYLKLRERCYGLYWNETEELLEKKGQGALDGSIDKWIEVLQLVSGFEIGGSGYLQALKSFLNGDAEDGNPGGDDRRIDLEPLVKAWT